MPTEFAVGRVTGTLPNALHAVPLTVAEKWPFVTRFVDVPRSETVAAPHAVTPSKPAKANETHERPKVHLRVDRSDRVLSCSATGGRRNLRLPGIDVMKLQTRLAALVLLPVASLLAGGAATAQ